MRIARLAAAALLAASLGAGSALAEDGHGTNPPREKWSFAGMFGRFDQAQLRIPQLEVFIDVTDEYQDPLTVKLRIHGVLAFKKRSGRQGRIRIRMLDAGCRLLDARCSMLHHLR